MLQNIFFQVDVTFEHVLLHEPSNQWGRNSSALEGRHVAVKVCMPYDTNMFAEDNHQRLMNGESLLSLISYAFQTFSFSFLFGDVFVTLIDPTPTIKP